MRLRAWVSQVASSASRVSEIGCHQSNLIAVRGGKVYLTASRSDNQPPQRSGTAQCSSSNGC